MSFEFRKLSRDDDRTGFRSGNPDLDLAARMADELGCVGLVVDAKPEAVGFYERLGFVRVDVVAGELGDRPQPTVLFLEIAQLV